MNVYNKMEPYTPKIKNKEYKHRSEHLDIIITKENITLEKLKIKAGENYGMGWYATLFFFLQGFTPKNKCESYSHQNKNSIDSFLQEVKYLLKNRGVYNSAKRPAKGSDEFNCKYTPNKSDKYSSRFDKEEISDLIKVGCPPNKANEYPRNSNGRDIALLFAMGISPYKARSPIFREILHYVRGALILTRSSSNIIEIVRKLKEAREFNQLGTGASGVVLFKKGNAWKFSKQISQEYGLLKRIQDYHNGKQKNIIKIKSKPQKIFKIGFSDFVEVPNPILKVEYLNGTSLENLLKEQHSLPKNKIIRYALNIVNGLIEMRKAGVWYHRDIRPANIVIDKKKDRAVIIDFGIATTNKKLSSKYNRRYGGINDLTSLGQIIYKMATGEHLFAKSKSMERTTYAQEIKDYRDKVYSDKTGKLLEKHFKQIDKKIKDERLSTLIKACLTAKNYRYKKIQKMFEEFN